MDGELRTTIIWECFPNNTKICSTRTEDCTNCDGKFSFSILTCPSNISKTEEPKTQAGRTWKWPWVDKYRFKRAVPGRGKPRRRPKIGRGETEGSGKATKDTEGGKEEADTGKESDNGKKATDTDKEATDEDKVVAVFTCDDVCLEKNGKRGKGTFSYTSFKECERVVESKEGEEKKENIKDYVYDEQGNNQKE